MRTRRESLPTKQRSVPLEVIEATIPVVHSIITATQAVAQIKHQLRPKQELQQPIAVEQVSSARIREALLKIRMYNVLRLKHIGITRKKINGARAENPDGIAGFVNNSL